MRQLNRAWKIIATTAYGLGLVAAASCSEPGRSPSNQTGAPGNTSNPNDTSGNNTGPRPNLAPGFDGKIDSNKNRLAAAGRDIFRYDTFGSEKFWGDTLGLHRAIAGAQHGGVGTGLDPTTALAVGLKVDVEKLPAGLPEQITAGKVDLKDPATTLALLQADAVVGVKGIFDQAGTLTSVGIRCSLCHSTVDDSLTKGIGKRLDGWPNRDLDVGRVIMLAPNRMAIAGVLGVDLATLDKVLSAWGPGKFDAELTLDGKGFRPDGKSAATLIPAAYGLAGQNLHTYSGWGSIPYWNAFVANLEMHGQGNFFDPRLNDPVKFPIAVKAGLFDVRVPEDQDMISAKLPALQFYQLAIPAPAPPAGSFDAAAAARGDALFAGKADCARCHTAPLYSEPGWAMHTGAEIGIDEFQAQRAPDNRYRTTPLRGLWAHAKGGFYHDGRFATLLDVVNHYDAFFKLGLTDGEKNDVVEYMKSLGGEE